MKIYLSRESVCAGDDCAAPHSKTISVAAGTPIIEVLSQVSKSGYLANIAGGLATWSAASNLPLAVIAQQWSQPKALPALLYLDSNLDIKDGILRIHFNYHAQRDPELVYEILSGLKLNAI